MAKSKFMLTDDLVKVEPELTPSEISTPYKDKNIKKTKKIHIEKERISLNIDSNLKMELQLFCIKNKISMSEYIEEAIKKGLGNQNKINANFD